MLAGPRSDAIYSLELAARHYYIQKGRLTSAASGMSGDRSRRFDLVRDPKIDEHYSMSTQPHYSGLQWTEIFISPTR